VRGQVEAAIVRTHRFVHYNRPDSRLSAPSRAIPDASGAQADHPQRRVLPLCDRQCSDAAWLGAHARHTFARPGADSVTCFALFKKKVQSGPLAHLLNDV
jgi:hypothetical protein